MGEIRIENSFELLSQEEWDRYLGTNIFDELRIDESVFGVSENTFENLDHPQMYEIIQEHNNKVGSLIVTYALCRHYYDKGIPDDPWYASPGDKGQSIQYMPLFKEEHWMRQYWFNYFSDTFYLKISSVWDSIIDIINIFYKLNYPSDLRLRSNVLKWLKSNKPDINHVFEDILQEQIYKDAQKYRTAAAHGTSAGTVKNTVKEENDVWTEVHATGDDGKPILDAEGRVTMKKVKALKVVSMRVGDYINAATIADNMEAYSVYSGIKIKEIVSLLR
jgi:hypothetical protein